MLTIRIDVASIEVDAIHVKQFAGNELVTE